MEKEEKGKDNIQETPAAKAENGKKRTDAGGRSFMQLLRRLTADDQENTEAENVRVPVNFRTLLGGDYLTKGWFMKNFWYIAMLVVMVVVYVGSRYSCQQEMIATKALTDTLLDRRYKALTRLSQLKERTLRSVIEESLEDTTLQTAATPSYNLKVDEE